MLVWRFCIGLVAAALLVSEASAQSQKQYKWCNGHDATPDMTIGACTALIRSGRISKQLHIALTNRALAYFKSKDFDKALADLNQTLRISPKYPVALGTRALVFYAENQYARALTDVDAALAAGKPTAGLYTIQGDTYRALGSFAPAVTSYTNALAIDPRHASALAGRAFAYGGLGKPGLALPDSIEALKLDPNNTFYLRSRANAYRLGRQYQQAVADYNAILDKAPNDRSALLMRGFSHFGLHAYAEALADADKVIALGASKDALSFRAEVYLSTGKIDAAIADCTKAIAEDPRYLGALKSCGRASARKYDFKESRRYYEAAQRIDIKDPDVLVGVAAAYFALNDDRFKSASARAIEALDKEIADDPDLPTDFNNRALLYSRNGDIDRAIDDYGRAIKLDPGEALYFANRCSLRLKKNETDLAQSDCERAVGLNPSNLEGLTGLCGILLDKHQTQRARGYCDDALELNPAEARALYFRARLKGIDGDRFGETSDYAAVYRIDPSILPERLRASIAALAVKPVEATTPPVPVSAATTAATPGIIPQDVISALRKKVAAAWVPPMGEMKSQDWHVVLQLSMLANGNLSAPPSIGSECPNKAFCDSAIQAIFRSQPLTMLQAVDYKMWRKMEFDFRLSDVSSGEHWIANWP